MKEFIQTNRKTLLIVVTVLLGITFTITFAYFANIIGDEAVTSSKVTSKGTRSLIFTEGDTLSIHATKENFAEGLGSLSDETTATATLTRGDTETEATEHYYVYFKINSNDYVYSTPDQDAEILLEIIDPSGNKVKDIDGLTYVDTTDAVTGEALSGYDITTHQDTIIIKSNYEIYTNTETPVTQNWTAKITFVNLPVEQNANQAKRLDAEFIIGTESPYPALNEYLIENHNEAEHGLIQHTSADPNSDQSGDYRYSGSDTLVKNYVTFNDEMWRIIGVFDTVKADETVEPLVKIIRDESLGKYAFDPEEENSWSKNGGGSEANTAELNWMLNEYYYNSTTAPNLLADCGVNDRGTCDFTTTGLSNEARAMIEEVKWSLRKVSVSVWNQKPLNFYYEEKTGTDVSSVSGADVEWIGNIGLMYPSDYLYAAGESYWGLYNYASANSTNDYYYNTEMQINNWMFDLNTGENEWAISSASSSNDVWRVINKGIMDFDSANTGYTSRPVLYLSSGVKIVSGTGSEADPFQVVI